MNLVTNVTKREYPVHVRRKRDGVEFTMLIEAESEAAAKLLIPDTVELVEKPSSLHQERRSDPCRAPQPRNGV